MQKDNSLEESLLIYKKKEYQKLISLYKEFTNNYKDKLKATEDYEKKTIKDEKALIQFSLNDTTYADKYKKELFNKMRKEEKINNTPFLCDDFSKIKEKYEKILEIEQSNNLTPTFDYRHFDISSKYTVAVLYTKHKAYKKFRKYLSKKRAKLQSKEKSLYEEVQNIKAELIDGILLRAENKELFIVELQKELYKRGLINIDISEFEKHFKDSVNVPKIKWYGTTPEIIYLFEFIKIANQSIYDVIINHFLDKKSNPFKRQKLYSARGKMTSNQKKIMPIIDILKKIK